MISSPPVVQISASSGELHTLSIPPIAIRSPDVEVREREKVWNQVYLLMTEIPTQNLYQVQLHITEDLSLRAQATKFDFDMLASKHAEIQKVHLELKQKQAEMQKV